MKVFLETSTGAFLQSKWPVKWNEKN